MASPSLPFPSHPHPPLALLRGAARPPPPSPGLSPGPLPAEAARYARAAASAGPSAGPAPYPGGAAGAQALAPPRCLPPSSSSSSSQGGDEQRGRGGTRSCAPGSARGAARLRWQGRESRVFTSKPHSPPGWLVSAGEEAGSSLPAVTRPGRMSHCRRK